jgi:peptidoglycan/LPS O-acetylase OafA/YrhL
MASSVRPPSDARLDVLDGLRGIAILMVVWWHLWLFSWLTPNFTLFGHPFSLTLIPGTGLMGVELFFFISGFVLFYPYARHLFEGKPLQTVVDFVYRRFIKIVPSYVIALVAALLLLWTFSSVRDVVWQVVTHLLFIHIFWTDTWVGINGVLWSLGVEVQFYLIFPLICMAFRRWPFGTYAAMVAVAVLYRTALGRDHANDYVIMGQLPAYLDLFANGMLAAWLFVFARNRIAGVERFRWLALLVALGAGAGLYAMLQSLLPQIWAQAYQPWQTTNRVYFGALLGVFTIGSLFAYRWWHAVIANRLFVFLGVISYNLYLWHNVIMLAMLQHHVPASRMADPHADGHWKWVYTVWSLALSLAVSTFITYAIERPLLKRGVRAITDLFPKRGVRGATAASGKPAPTTAAGDG